MAHDHDKTAARPAAEPQPAADATPADADELTNLRREVAELRDKNLRLAAEGQNLHKRAQREKQETLRYAEAEFARELLVILDDLQRTEETGGTADAQAVIDGVRILREHFLKIPEQRSIPPIEAVGRPFDPSFHEAIAQLPSTEQPAGTVMQELARGYTMHERVLRPARVIVSGGAPDAKAASGEAR